MIDVLIIGAGPAGISAGLYAKRSNVNVLILYSGESNLEKAHKIDNYYGFVDGVNGKELFDNGLKQAENLGIEIKKEEVLEIEKEGKIFKVKTLEKEYEAKSIIIATGNKKLKPNIKGIDEFEGKGISYCAICDGFFYRNKNIVVIGNGKFAINEAKVLKNIAKEVTILTNGIEESNELKECDEFEVVNKEIEEIHGELKVNKIEFKDKTTLDIDGVFIAIGEAGGVDFAKRIGVITKNNTIVVDENMKTNIEGLYSCGDTNGGLLQVSKAIYEGAKAGLASAKYIRNKNI